MGGLVELAGNELDDDGDEFIYENFKVEAFYSEVINDGFELFFVDGLNFFNFFDDIRDIVFHSVEFVVKFEYEFGNLFNFVFLIHNLLLQFLLFIQIFLFGIFLFVN